MKCVLVLICLAFIQKTTRAAMSEAQLKAAVRLVQNVCQPKTKMPTEEIEKMHRGEWDMDPKYMCYLHCTLGMRKLMTKDNHFNYEVGVQTANREVPVARRNATLASMVVCKDSAKTVDDKCVAAYEVSRCIYESNPENYFLP